MDFLLGESHCVYTYLDDVRYFSSGEDDRYLEIAKTLEKISAYRVTILYQTSGATFHFDYCPEGKAFYKRHIGWNAACLNYDHAADRTTFRICFYKVPPPPPDGVEEVASTR